MGSRFGREHHFDLDSRTPAEAFAALASQIKGLRDYWLNAHKQGIRFAVFVGKRNLPREHLSLPANDVIRIAPVLAGSKRGGVLNVIVGAVLVVLDVWVFHTGYIAEVGWGMIVGGAIQMLTPMPHGRTSQDRGVDSESSYNFNGPVNTQAQGNPVPLAYGEVYAGSAVVSAGIDVVDTSYTGAWSRGNPKLGYMGGGAWSGGYREIGFIDPEP
jgi:predicted phage tail protein